MKSDKWYCTGQYDPISLNAVLFDRRAPFEKLIPQNVVSHGMWYYAWRIIYSIIKDAAKIIIRFPLGRWLSGTKGYSDVFKDKVVFLCNTTNNARSLERVICLTAENKDNVIVLNEAQYYKSFPQLLLFIISLENSLNLYSEIKKLSPADRRIAGYYISHLFRASGYVYSCSKILNRFRPECIVTANDHIYDRKALAYICEELGVKTMYVQHASVSYAFPALHFTYSFLDGKDSFEKYTAEGKVVKGTVILLGAIRYDKLSDYRLKRKKGYRKCVGLAINKLDRFAIVSNLCNQILTEFPDCGLKVRAHPSIKSNPLDVKEKARLKYTNAKEESMEEYLDSIDVQIAGDSGVHFDALIGGVPTLAFNFSSSPYGDNYKYVSNGLIRYADGFNEVCEYFENIDQSTANLGVIRQYDESFGKSYSGHCSEIVADMISSNCDFDSLKEKYGIISDTVFGRQCYVIPE